MKKIRKQRKKQLKGRQGKFMREKTKPCGHESDKNDYCILCHKFKNKAKTKP